mgnify:FL=1
MTFVEANGVFKEVAAPDGHSVLEIAHENSIELEGVCEGSMACSTCHVIVGRDWFRKIEPPSEEEEDILDLAFGLTETSRLGCQIIMSENLDGLTVHVPSEHHNFLN